MPRPAHYHPPVSGDRTLSTAQVAWLRRKVRRPGRFALHVLDGPSSGVHELEQRATLGRSHVADVTIEHGSVSKLHAELELTRWGVRLRDLGSKNGTWVLGRRVEALHLAAGDEFAVGECWVRLASIDEIEVAMLESERFGRLWGSSLVMRELYAQLEALAPTPLDLLIQGETGTGKELTAQTIHELSCRKGRFIVLDCAALSTTLADGTLFGFRKGAFTGADHDQPGAFEEADGGTLFIDEVGELPLELQRKLLGVLERRELTRLGEPGKPRTVDVRVVAATHRDLRQEVAEGGFREDLYYRLARALVYTPPLRDREEDIVELANSFLRRVCLDHGLEVNLDDGARTALRQHSWPGNVRELRNVIERAAHIRRQGQITARDLMLGAVRTLDSTASIADALGSDKSYAEVHDELDRLLLPRLLERYDHNISHISQHLGISRDRLRRRLRELGLYSRR
jgi:DNA-binding NtrC family response regulator